MFVDASALVAILSEERDGPILSARIDAAEDLYTSPIAVFETVIAMKRKSRLTADEVSRHVHAFLDRSQIRVLGVSKEASDLAIEAHARYGKGSGHPAGLNLGDCFAYAMARQHGVPLLYKGDDFARTDLA